MDKALVAQTVANKLLASENAVDTAIVEATTLLSGLIQARLELRVSATVGDKVVGDVSAAIAALTTARHSLVEAHNEVAQTKLRLGIRTKLFGVQGKEPFASAVDELADVG